MSKPLRVLSRDEVEKHNKDGDLWIVIDSAVYDLSKFAKLHPGGLAVLLDEDVAGQDATTVFYSLHRHEVLQKPQYARLVIGHIALEEPRIRPVGVGELSRVPYAESPWLNPSFHSPYYNDGHRALQKEFRAFVDTVITPDAQACEASGKNASPEVYKAMAEKKVNHMRLGPGKHLHGLTLMGGVKGEDYDYFHELIVTQELTRMGARGYATGLGSGVFLGLPPVMNYGAEPLRSRVIDEVLNGKKVMCLAITEAFAGSDVQGMKCRADKQEDGSWLINGHKKWISAGMWADYILLAAKTYGGDGPDGAVTAFLVDRSMGFETKAITTSYSKAAGTSYVTFDNVRVPADHVIGEEGHGLLIIFGNFNHERWYMCASMARGARGIIEECLLWSAQRRVFGKPLLAQAVVRNKLALMIAKAEAMQTWIEHLTFQMTRMDHRTQVKQLAGPISFCKMQFSLWEKELADHAVQIFGGRAVTATGMGRFIELANRTARFDAVLGGSEEVLGDLGVRQLIRYMPEDQKL
ncbi:hypothetical protein VHUM_02068 [Vanrija humicola]|uniref:Cytochrome b5 heme-binding domain-containing protein n=1 Tax=Vanrija humicola TaxID=5417 RepID=A0A7D8Z5Z4_VANHU|nr:hypothetical protein VHUM_02068 [Vanrija humicola]